MCSVVKHFGSKPQWLELKGYIVTDLCYLYTWRYIATDLCYLYTLRYIMTDLCYLYICTCTHVHVHMYTCLLNIASCSESTSCLESIAGLPGDLLSVFEQVSLYSRLRDFKWFIVWKPKNSNRCDFSKTKNENIFLIFVRGQPICCCLFWTRSKSYSI